MQTIEQAILKAYKQGVTDRQAIFDKLPKVNAWIARDNDNTLTLFIGECTPKKDNEYWYVEESSILLRCTEQDLPECCNPQWKDENPIEVELTINLKKGE